MTRSGPTIHVKSRRGRRPFDWLERLEIYPQIAAGIASGDSDLEVARVVGVSDKTVSRYRRRMKDVEQ